MSRPGFRIPGRFLGARPSGRYWALLPVGLAAVLPGPESPPVRRRVGDPGQAHWAAGHHRIGVAGLSVYWDDVDGADDYRVRWRSVDDGARLNEA